MTNRKHVGWIVHDYNEDKDISQSQLLTCKFLKVLSHV